ncbi:hypothetical protein BCR35DRAFT_44820 [Leucosporidium creatinivorum]|uniref:Uncharacterized protein n=1 Tax=Leucosporidium creatinivorum TaxID=106004 RepID=A0A1Y2FRT5_9BASI|nr:hypothetical protein BCR35DRAFT_44820 [Leucosporidium creatinivorum]
MFCSAVVSLCDVWEGGANCSLAARVLLGGTVIVGLLVVLLRQHRDRRATPRLLLPCTQVSIATEKSQNQSGGSTRSLEPSTHTLASDHLLPPYTRSSTFTISSTLPLCLIPTLLPPSQPPIPNELLFLPSPALETYRNGR